MFSQPLPALEVDKPSKNGEARFASAWTPQRTRRAVRLYLVERFTAAEVADALGPPFSRAAVVSKMRRLGHLKRECHAAPASAPPSRRAGTPRAAAHVSSLRIVRLPPQAPPQPLPPLRETGPTGTPVPLAALPSGACHWPIDDPGSGRMHLTLFCGGPAGGHAYCPAHRALAARQPR